MFSACVLFASATMAMESPTPAPLPKRTSAQGRAATSATATATKATTTRATTTRAPAVALKPTAAPTTKAPATSGSFRTYLTQAGCGSVGIVSGPGRYAEADWYNNRVILGTSVQGSTQWIAYHECAHFKQLWQYGSVNGVWSHFGDSMARIECDADRRAAAQLGWNAGRFCS